MQRFKNKVALITGGTNGMGFATAQQFINEGGNAIVTGRSTETVNKALAQLGENDFGIVSNASNNQQKDTVLILKYGKGGHNTLHQDLYGDIYFTIHAS